MIGNYGTNFHNRKVDVHEFAMIPRAEIPRSSFRMQNQHKTTFSASKLIPIYLQEVLPGDSFNVSMTAFVRMATPLFPLMDNLDVETFFFFVPNRLVWINWYKFMGEQENPADSISFSIPQVVSAAGGFPRLGLFDYFGIGALTNQVLGGNTITVSVLPLRAYQIIFNQWFRDENLQNAATYGSGSTTGIAAMDNGPDPLAQYVLQTVNKRHDYFTSCLPWTQKGGVAVTLPLGTQAIVRTSASELITPAQATGLTNMGFYTNAGAVPVQNVALAASFPSSGTAKGIGATTTAAATTQGAGFIPMNLYADLSTATASTINAIRLAFQTQKLLERDARGGTRYTEIIRSHFGVVSPDMRLQRPEYLGGGKSPVTITPVPQTATFSTNPLGSLAAVGTGVASGHGFRQSFTEHGHIIGLAAVRQDMGYQQGIRRLWKRSTRYDFYFPVFSALGEQSVFNYEIYSDGSANDALTFGFQERWAEYRYHPSFTSGFFSSTIATPLDAWHLQEKFSALPTLAAAFIADSTQNQVRRAVAAGAAANDQQFLADFFFDQKVARPMPMYSVPGMIDHF